MRSLTLHRALQYEALERVNWCGNILDIGGGAAARYRNIIERSMRVTSYESINVDPKIEPTYVADLSKPFDIPVRAYDIVVSINTFEHLRKPEEIIKRIPSLLVPGGRIVVVIPFLIRVHPSPHDYVRLTSEWWIETLAETGFTDIVVEPLVWDPFSSSAAVCAGVGPLKLVRRLLSPICGLLYASVKGFRGMRYPVNIGEKVGDYALGYLVEARHASGCTDVKL